jgi:lipopolysaccharide export LptBFGC system permease protein LptF
MIPKLDRKIDDLQADNRGAFEIRMMQDDQGTLLRAGRYTPPAADRPATMEVVDIIERDDNGAVTRHITADRARWQPEQSAWRLENGRGVTGLLPDQQRSEPKTVDQWRTSVTPEEIALYRSGDFVELLSTPRIRELLSRPKLYGTTDLLRVMYGRLGAVLVNFTLLLLAIACLLQRDPSQLKAGMMRCIGLVGLCMGVVFITQNMAGRPPPNPSLADNWPVLMAALPVLIFLPLAVWLLDRLHRLRT